MKLAYASSPHCVCFAKLLAVVALISFYATSFGVEAAAAQTPDKCSNLKTTFSRQHTTITSAETMPPGSTSQLKIPESNRRPPLTDLPTFCRVIATLTPSSDSKIGVEVWLPTSGWNGKLQSIANHLSGGTYYYGDMGDALRRNYAVASTDTGHSPAGDARTWAKGHPEKIVDFSWRAVHEMTLTAKALIATFYGTAPRLSYYNGCSTGGRQTLKEAQMFPDDYDGILSGSGFHYLTHFTISNVWKTQVMLQDGVGGASYLPPSKHKLVVNAAMNACKALKQVPTDDFLGNPTRCAWDPMTLVCKAGQDPNSCITAPQARALEKAYQPVRNPRTHAEIYPGATRVTVPNWPEAAVREAANPDRQPANESATLIPPLVSPNAHWDWRTMNFDSDVAVADEADAKGPRIDAVNPDLSKFKRRGGKVIEFQGWLDSNLAPYSVQHYENVVAEMGKQGGTNDDAALKETQNFYRLFMAPGMGHCSGGPGPNAFGGVAQPVVSSDPQHDIFSALEQWVEHGVAPTQIIATKYVNDEPKQGIAMQRPLCPYPQEARYKGAGSTTDASSFACVNETRNLKPSIVNRGR